MVSRKEESQFYGTKARIFETVLKLELATKVFRSNRLEAEVEDSIVRL
jgi:hypothetical protein